MKRSIGALFLLLSASIGLGGYLVTNNEAAVETNAVTVGSFDSSIVIGSENTAYSEYSNDNWIVTLGGAKNRVGTNSNTTNRAKLNLDNHSYLTTGNDVPSNDSVAIISKKRLGGITTINLGWDGYQALRGSVYVLKAPSDDVTYDKATYSVVETATINKSSYTFDLGDPIDGYFAIVLHDSNTTGEYRFNNVLATFESSAYLDSLSYSGTPVTQYVGEAFNPEGLSFIAHYSDGATKEVPTSAIRYVPFGLLGPDDTSIFACYDEGNSTRSVEITGYDLVEPRTETGIEIVTLPTKLVYKVGDTLDTSGIAVNVVYSDDSRTPLSVDQLSFDPTTLETVGTQTITVSYTHSWKATFDVTVEPIGTLATTYVLASGDFDQNTWSKTTDDGVSYEYRANWLKSSYFGFDNTKGFQFGSGNNPLTTLNIRTSIIDLENKLNLVSRVVINASGASKINATLSGATNNEVTQEVSLTSTPTDYVFDFISPCAGHLDINISNDSEEAVYISSITIYCYEDVNGIASVAKLIEETDSCANLDLARQNVLVYEKFVSDHPDLKASLDAIKIDDYQDGDVAHAKQKVANRMTVGEKVAVLLAIITESANSNSSASNIMDQNVIIAISVITLVCVLSLSFYIYKRRRA